MPFPRRLELRRSPGERVDYVPFVVCYYYCARHAVIPDFYGFGEKRAEYSVSHHPLLVVRKFYHKR